MRTHLITGPAGAGRTTVAAATALAAAASGLHTLVVSTDPYDTLGAALATPTGPAPVAAAPNLTALRPDPAERFRADLLALQDRAGSALGLLGVPPLDGEELPELPGGEELALLRALREAAAGPFDLVVVDLPPTARALTALALPAALRRCLRRLLPEQGQAAAGLRPVLGRLAGMPVPSADLYEAAARWDLELALVQGVIEDADTTAALVAEPGPSAVEEVRAATVGLALHGLPVRALLANRVVPPAAGAWAAALRAEQRTALDTWADGHRVRELPHLGRAPRGRTDLAALDTGWGPVGAAADGGSVRAGWPLVDRLAEDGVLVWHIPLPGAVRDELDLVRRGDEIVLSAGRARRTVPLPSALRRCAVSGAGLREGELRIRFTPDPDLWPTGR